MEDDAVLLADDDEMGALTASALQSSPPAGSPGSAEPSPSTPMDDSEMVIVDEADAARSPQSEAQMDASPAAAQSIPSDPPASALQVQQDVDTITAEVSAVDDKIAVAANPFVAAAGGSSVSEPSTASAGVPQATVAAAAEAGSHNGVVDPSVDSRQDVCIGDSKYWPGMSHPVQVADEVV